MTAAGLACVACGTELPPNSKFCNECGSRIADSGSPAEYKQVTVLFADVVRSMDIAAAVDVERLREIMTELVDQSAAVVRRYGAGSVEYTGDGIMALFGAPVALEDHAFRACLAALAIQEEANRLAGEVQRRDDVALRLRVGLNSGRVIAGDIGSESLGYRATGEPVGFAQRMESAAPAGGVLLSESTARLVEHLVMLGAPERVRIKGAGEPVGARRLMGIRPRGGLIQRAEASLVGRRWELSIVEGLLDRAVEGQGAVVGVVGSPGIGKSRLAREVAAMAHRRNVEVFSTFCESHATDIPFLVVARLLRTALGVEGLDAEAARAQVHARVRDADPEDLALFDDLLGIGDPDIDLPKIAPDARRRRLTALVNAASLARQASTIYLVEDAHWIDEVSESMLAEFLTVIPQTPSLVLVTYRPEYRGALTRVAAAHTVALAPLSDSETMTLVCELLGPHPSNSVLSHKIAERATGNPFFAEEMVRELAERGVLQGHSGAYVATADVSAATVPATVQATIAARIDRLNPNTKRTLSAAAVIGSRFGLDLLETLGVESALEDLVAAELIDQARLTGQPEYVFRHPLIRKVAYESQLKSHRTELHQRVAAAIESREPAAAGQNAALIAEHLEAAGDVHPAYGWHMRAATWATNRDINAARLSWERAQRIADTLPADDPNRTAMRIAPRTMLCGIAYRVHLQVAGARFDELREMCIAAGDKASLAIAMVALVLESMYQERVREASRLASEAMALIESIGDPTLTVGLSFAAVFAKGRTGEWSDALGWSQRIIDLADGDPSKGNFIIGSPLAFAIAVRGCTRYCVGRPGGRDDVRHGLDMARSTNPMSYVQVVLYVYFGGITFGFFRPDDSAMRAIEDAVQIAERAGHDFALAQARETLGFALVHHDSTAERDRGQQLMAEVGEMFRRQGQQRCDLPILEVYLARERARRGDRDGAIPVMRAAVDDLDRQGQLLCAGIPATGVLVETLLVRGTGTDVIEAESAIERLATAPADGDLAIREIWLLRLRALLARARGDEARYREHRDRYRDMAKTLDCEGHIAWAEAMP
jgi:class 3 adenylate cyclase